MQIDYDLIAKQVLKSDKAIIKKLISEIDCKSDLFSSKNKRFKTLVEIRCLNCNKIFSRNKHHTFLTVSYTRTYSTTSCSRRCAAFVAVKYKDYTEEEKLKISKSNFIREYREVYYLEETERDETGKYKDRI